MVMESNNGENTSRGTVIILPSSGDVKVRRY